MSEYTLACLIDGHNVPFTVEILSTKSISVLKKEIKKEASHALEKFDAMDLVLWKLDGVDYGDPATKESIQNRTFLALPRPAPNDKPLDDLDAISDIWSGSLPKRHIQVLVGRPEKMSPLALATGHGSPKALALAPLEESDPKRRRLADKPKGLVMTRLTQFWEDLWQHKVNLFHEVSVIRDLNPVDGVDVPATVKVLHLSKIFSALGDVMVRDDYDEALKAIEDYHAGDTKSVIILGHPGIGKTILLYYILAKRLFEEKPTIFQYTVQYLFFFNADGVKVLNPSEFVDPESEEYHGTWALVDINKLVKRPADMLCDPTSTFFLVMASSPTASRMRQLQKYRRPADYWLMKPFTLGELIQARQLQEIVLEESVIKNFFEKYGPSARDCYEYGKARLGSYEAEVRAKVKELSWDSITVILTSHAADMPAIEGSHKVLLIEPRPDDRALSRTRVVTKTVNQLLWERDSGEKWRNHRKLFKTLLREPSARSFCGKLFEPAFHALCIRGATFTIYPMAYKEGPRYYKFVSVGSEPGLQPENLRLNPQNPFFFDYEQNKVKITSLDDCYYQPISDNYPSLDSFVYDRDSCQLSAFQVTIAGKHDFSPKGVTALRNLGQDLKINNLKIRVIVVVFEGFEVTLNVDPSLFHSLDLQVYMLNVTENQLYPDL